MKQEERPTVDWSGKEFPIGIDAPLAVTFHPDVGELVVRSVQLHQAVAGGIVTVLRFSPAATAELLAALRQIETTLGMPIGSTTKLPNLQ